MKTRYVLQPANRFKLFNWLAANSDAMKGKARTDIAEQATKELGFEVSARHIDNAELAIGVKVGRVRAPKPEKVETAQQFLAKTIVALCGHLGEAIDPRLQRIADGAEA